MAVSVRSGRTKKGGWFSPTAQKLKKEGVKRGIPDIFLPCARGGSHGLFIEMKARDGKVSEEQAGVHKLLWKKATRSLCAIHSKRNHADHLVSVGSSILGGFSKSRQSVA